MNNFHQLDADQVLQQFNTNATCGLSSEEANRRLAQHGGNEFPEQPPKSIWLMLWEQLIATTVVILIVAAIISAFLGDYKDMLAILAIVVFNAILGVNQEYRAGKAFAALKKLAVPIVTVCREAHWQKISASQLVPGDIVRLEAGDRVPADGRLFKSTNLCVQEAAFTGESEPVEKATAAIAQANLPLGDRTNMVYMGTVITYGHGCAVITATGMQTELGKIAQMMQTVEQEPTPLQRRLEHLGQRLAIAALALVAVIFGLGLLRGESIHLLILTAVSMGVAIVPEGLPAVVTIALALGARRMLQRNALIRKLPAVETLGSVTVICSDKTGTLTENRMTVTVIDLAGQHIDLMEDPLSGQTTIAPAAAIGPPLQPALAMVLTGSTLCSNVLRANQAATESEKQLLGDPTEVALVVAAAQLGLEKADLEQEFPRVAEVPFDSDRKRMTTIHQFPMDRCISPGGASIWQWICQQGQLSYIAFTKGAVGKLLDVCTQIWVNDRLEPLQAEWRETITATNDQLAKTGMRVLGVAFQLLETLPTTTTAATLEQNLTFVGMVGMLDPARREVKAAVQDCQTAGIRPIMITGDHPLMAQHIAEELGISTNGRVLTGVELEQHSLDDLEQHTKSVSVYARVSPQQKLKIVQLFQAQGHIVAMTGDGVNDAPALRKADIGVAMGITGTDVAKEAADMVLLDDNFATIVAAVQEGRVIYDNIRKFLKYSMTGNASGVWIMLLSPLLVMPLPLLPLQILWINLLADGLLAVALSVEPAESNIMRRPPYRPGESVFGRGVGRDIIWVGMLMGVAILLLGYSYWINQATTWQTMIFTTLACSRMSLALAMRSERDSLVHIGLLTNKPILGAVALTFILQLAIIYTPWLQTFFQTMSLSIADLTISLAVSTIGFWAIEVEKWILRQRKSK